MRISFYEIWEIAPRAYIVMKDGNNSGLRHRLTVGWKAYAPFTLLSCYPS
jgi:hypothetical protein